MSKLKDEKSNRLTPDEHIFLSYFLSMNIRTFKSAWGIPALRSLVIKGHLRDEGGPVNATKYVVSDKAWNFMQENRSFLLPDNIAKNLPAITELEECVHDMVHNALTDKEINHITYEPFARGNSEHVTFTAEDSYKIIRINKMSKKASEFSRKYNVWEYSSPLYLMEKN